MIFSKAAGLNIYPAGHKQGKTVDVLLRSKRDIGEPIPCLDSERESQNHAKRSHFWRRPGDVSREGRKPIFGRLFLTFGPFDHQPLLGWAFRERVISIRYTGPHSSKARRQRLGRPLPPFDPAPGALGEAESELFDRDRYARRRDEGALVVARSQTISSAAVVPCQASTPWYSARYRPHRSTQARGCRYADLCCSRSPRPSVPRREKALRCRPP